MNLWLFTLRYKKHQRDWWTNTRHPGFEQWHDYLGPYKESLSERCVISFGSATTYKHEYYRLIHKLFGGDLLAVGQTWDPRLVPENKPDTHVVWQSYGEDKPQMARFENFGLKWRFEKQSAVWN